MISTVVAHARQRWGGPGGYREVLAMAVPLVLSTAAWSIQHFVDRMFLAWYSPEAVAAAMPAGMMAFALSTFFVGTAGYASTFVAQYHGAKRDDRIGASLWQGLYIALFGGLLLAVPAAFSEGIFRFIGHGGAVERAEADYFRILSLGAVFSLVSGVLSTFFSGRGRNWPITVVNLLSTATNCLLNWLLIFGNAGFPRMGIRGAAIGTVAASLVSMLAYAALVFRRRNDERYGTRRAWRPERELFLRLLRYGAPSGVQFFVDTAGFTAFLLIMGRLGTAELAATNIAFNINTLAFMPMIGCGIAVGVLVGHYLGEDKPDDAERSVISGFHLTMFYMGSIAAAYVLVPGVFTAPFAARAHPETFAPIEAMARVLLRFVALYSIFDTMTIVFSSAIKGAGDTRFAMVVIAGLSLGGLVVPSYVALVLLDGNVYVGWIIVTAYISSLGLCFYLRFASGRWRSMRVIEPAPLLPPTYPETPVAPMQL